MRKASDRLWKDLMLIDLEEGEEPKSARSGVDPVARSAKRSRLERFLDILQVVSKFGPIKRTHILYRANLAWSELQDSLQALQEAGALSKVVNKKGVFYKITEIGEKALSYYVDIQSSLDEK